MKRVMTGAVLTAAPLLASMAMADTMKPQADRNPTMPAIATDESAAAQVAPAAGSNSFTMAQATTKLQEQGYSRISGLKNDKDGIWRGTATKAGVKQNVAVDYQGNVRAQ